MNDNIRKDIERIKDIESTLSEINKDKAILDEQNKYAMLGIAKSIEHTFSDEKMSQIKFKDLDAIAKANEPGFFKKLWNKIFNI